MSLSIPSVINSKKLEKFGTQLNKSLIDGIEALQCITSCEHPIGSREMSRMLGVDITKVNRLLRTLAYLGLVRQTPDRKYTSGAGMQILAAQSLYATGMINSAIRPLESLKDMGLLVAMGVLWQDKVTYLYHAQPGMDVVDALGSMGCYPATISGIGMSLLSELDEDEIDHLYLDKEIEGYPGGLSQLKEKLQEIRELGYARVETTPSGIIKKSTHTIAVNVGQPVYSAIALSGWLSEDVTEELVAVLKDKSKEIEERNGKTD